MMPCLGIEPGHIGVRGALSSLHHSCSPKIAKQTAHVMKYPLVIVYFLILGGIPPKPYLSYYNFPSSGVLDS